MIARRAQLSLLAAFAAGLLCMAGSASDPADRLPDPAQEARARHMFQQLRCVQCQNESIDDSYADIAQDLRRIVRTQISQGKSDAEIKAFLVQRYGEFILLTPTFGAGNLALWLTPFVVILLGGGFLWIKSRQPAVEDGALTEEEQRALDAMDADDTGKTHPHDGLTTAGSVAAIKH